MSINNMVIPSVLCAIIAYGLWRNIDLFDAFIEGAREGLSTAARILPSLVALMTCVGMFKASGALDFIVWASRPVAKAFFLPAEVTPLAILRPISGSGALVIFNDLLATHGPDSFIGRVASVMEGSSETTFYTIAVYYGAIKVNKTRHTLAASLTADFVAVIMSAVCVAWLFGN